MIKIKMHNGKWRVTIENEEWKFEDREKLEEVLSQILLLKDSFGRIN